jgi:hypothetical protein
MAKFCPLCNSYTNCTDNCNQCLANEEKEKNMTLEDVINLHKDAKIIARTIGGKYSGAIIADAQTNIVYADYSVDRDGIWHKKDESECIGNDIDWCYKYAYWSLPMWITIQERGNSK